MIQKRIGAAVVALVALSAALGAGPAWAPVPPKNCGDLKAGNKVFNIKADQMRCRRARRYSRRYLVKHRRPRGYDCNSYGRETRIKFRCDKGDRVFFAIRR